MSVFTGTVLVTGGTSGLGYEAALQLAQQRPEYQIIVASRKDSDSSAAAINKATGRQNAIWLSLDLSSMSNVRAFGDEYAKRRFPPLTALILNAALQINSGITYTEDGFETTFAVNHIGHAHLFYVLRPYLAPSARIITVASGVHDPAKKKPGAFYTSAEFLAHPPSSPKDDGLQHYANSKLANILWTYALDRCLRSSSEAKQASWYALVSNPGLMPGTGLARDAHPILQFLWLYVLPHLIWLLRYAFSPNVHTAQDSGFALGRLAIGDDEGVRGKSGAYFEGMREIKSSEDSYNESKQDDLWAWTARTVARDETERKRFEELL